LIANLSFVPLAIKVIVGIGLVIGLLVYIFANIALLTVMDIMLAMIHCHNTARKQFVLPMSFSVENTERKISRFGHDCVPTKNNHPPYILRYKSSFPVSTNSSGIDKVVATYHVDLLNRNEYRSIINSATINSSILKGKKKHRFLDTSQKNAARHCVTVIVIFAKQIDESFDDDLFHRVCRNGGDGFDQATIPCIVDLEKRICIFDSERLPYTGYQYPVKNHGIKLIKKCLFNNKFTFGDSHDMLELPKGLKDIDFEQSLWSFWKSSKKECKDDDKKLKKRYENMNHKDIIFEDSCIYLKWEERGVLIPVEINEETKETEIEPIDYWDYPKTNKIAKQTEKEIKKLLDAYFSEQGYTVKYIKE
jgi:hypothetical protein